MYKVLLVEDEVLVREAITESIVWNELGLQLVAACKNGKEALEVIEREVPDIVITDICMPYIDGMQLSKYVYENYPETKVIIFSGYDEFEYAKQALQYKVEEYLLKPVTLSELTELLINTKNKVKAQKKEKEDIKKLRGSYYKHLPAIRSQLFNDLILGNKAEEEYKADMKEAGVQLNKKYFKVAVLESEASHLSEFATGDNHNQSALLSFAIFNIVNEIMMSQSYGVAFEQKDKRIVMIFESDLMLEFENQVRAVCELVQDKIKKYLHLETLIGIGKKVTTLSKVYLSYQGAYEMTQYNYLLGEKCIVSQEDNDKKQSLLALDYIEKNYQNSELTLQMICKHLSMSPSYFSAVFKKETGETFIEVLTKKRMEEAKNLLKYTTLKNYEIAETVGFSDAHYFSQTFKKYAGKTPKEYAKESRDAL